MAILKKKPRLSKQEKAFVKIKALTGNGTLAVREAFDIEDSDYAGVKAHRLLRKDKIVNALQEALPDELLAQVHLEGLSAINIYEAPDYGVRHKYLDSAYKIKGAYAPEKSVNVNIDVAPNERLKELANKLNK